MVTPEAVLPDGALVLEAGLIRFAGPAREVPAAWRSAAVPEGWTTGGTLLPGAVDVHCHGGAGGEFGADAEGAATAARHHHRSGTTTLLGSLVSGSRAALVDGVRTFASLVAAGELAGIHLEGPFLSHARRGAQDPAALTDVDPSLLEALGEAAARGGAAHALTQMTYAPERPGGDDAARRCSPVGASSRRSATPTPTPTPPGPRCGRRWTPRRAAAGPWSRTSSTACRPCTTAPPARWPPAWPRPPAARPSWRSSATACTSTPGRCGCSSTSSAPTGSASITDAMAASGMPEGTYALGGRDVVVAGRTARLADGGSIAGGVATLLEVVRWCVLDAGVPLQDAVRAASRTPARTLALPDVGALEAGLPGRRPRRGRRPQAGVGAASGAVAGLSAT